MSAYSLSMCKKGAYNYFQNCKLKSHKKMMPIDNLKLDVDTRINMTFIKYKSCSKFQLSMTKHVKEKRINF